MVHWQGFANWFHLPLDLPQMKPIIGLSPLVFSVSCMSFKFHSYRDSEKVGFPKLLGNPKKNVEQLFSTENLFNLCTNAGTKRK